MPTYVYRNLSTNQTFELKQSMKDDALTVHPETGEPVKRLVSAPGIAFRGSGFYANDSRSGGKSKAEGAASTSDSGDSSKSDSSKPELNKSDTGKSEPSKSDSGKSDSGSKPTAAASSAPAGKASGSGE